ncbi:MAG: thioredoxin domain-containing protein [Thermoguttaceae bacterium]|jgi:thiol-disulfide isomerase/thioredoxin|nr:thioredoxin domain-containing protein [Thermoguttaceae bacterium]
MVSLPAALVSLTLLGTGETVLLDFYADWCGPCRAMHPTVQALGAKGYPVRKVNVDREPDLAKRHGVTALPTFVMLANGKEVARTVGGASFAQLEQMCQIAARQDGPPRPGAAVAADRPRRGPAGATEGQSASSDVIPTAAILPARESEPAVGSRLAPDDPDQLAPHWSPRRIAEEQLIAATVRLRIQDPKGHSSGTGTLIDARGGEALVLTCGHIFRDSQGQGRIEVDLFGPQASERIPGRLVAFDLKTDVGLVAIRVPGPVVTARVAESGYQLSEGQSVISVGCDNGADPTARHSRVNSLNKFLGPANIQVAGQPVEGRSGGGLFSPEGFVIGVCNAADPQDREGLFAAAECIHAILDSAGLSYVYDPAKPGPAMPDAPAEPAGSPVSLAAAEQPGAMEAEAAPRGALEEIRWPSPPAASPVRTVAATREDLPSLDRDERIALDEIRRRLDEGYEVVCIIRPRNDPQAKSEVLVLDEVSSGLLRHLEGAAHAAQRPRFTSSRQ